MTPRIFIEQARLELARKCLEDSEMPLKRVATQSGFMNVNVMRAAFLRQVGVGPHMYRAQCRA